MVTFATANANGTLTERLGIGLQNRVRRFESARYLQTKPAFGSVFCLEVPGRTRGKTRGFSWSTFFYFATRKVALWAISLGVSLAPIRLYLRSFLGALRTNKMTNIS